MYGDFRRAFHRTTQFGVLLCRVLRKKVRRLQAHASYQCQQTNLSHAKPLKWLSYISHSGFGTSYQDYIKDKVTIRIVFPNAHVWLDLLSKCSRVLAIRWAKRNLGSVSVKSALCWGGVLNMREPIGKKELWPQACSTRSLDFSRLHLERRSNCTWELGENIACHNLILYVILILRTLKWLPYVLGDNANKFYLS